MIVDKKSKVAQQQEEEQKVVVQDITIDEPLQPGDDNVTIEDVELNPIEEIYRATRRVLESLHEDPNNDGSPLLFKTVKVDNGQFERIIRTKGNTEYAVAFPAAFIRFVNVRYLTSQQRVGEGRATMRIRYVLNDLNNSDDIQETHGFRIFEQINAAIQDAKSYEPALNERCNLTYFDMPESLDNGLQPYWIDYEVWFRSMSGYQYRNWVDRYLVMPPFTDHSDQKPENNLDGHEDHNTPTYDEATGFVGVVDNGGDTDDNDDNSDSDTD